MNKEKWIVCVVVMALVGGAAVWLARVKSNHRLGNPALKMIAQPAFLDDDMRTPVGTNSVDLPLRVMDYVSMPLPVTKEEIDWLPKDTTYGRRMYMSYKGGREFQALLSIVLMGTDRTSIHKPQICLDGQGWKIDRSELAGIPVSKPHAYDLPIMKLTATQQSRAEDGQIVTRRAIFVYWFVAENRLTARHGERMWWMAKDLLTTGILQRWAYVTCMAVCYPGQEDETFQRLTQFIAAAVPEFQRVAGPATLPVRSSRGEGEDVEFAFQSSVIQGQCFPAIFSLAGRAWNQTVAAME